MDLAWQIFFGAYDETSELLNKFRHFVIGRSRLNGKGARGVKSRATMPILIAGDQGDPALPAQALGSQGKKARQWGKRFFSIFTRTVYSGSTIWMIGAFAVCETN